MTEQNQNTSIDLGSVLKGLQEGEDLSGKTLELGSPERPVSKVKDSPEQYIEKIIAMQMDQYQLSFEDALRIVKEQWEKQEIAPYIKWDKISKERVMSMVKFEAPKEPPVIVNTPEGRQQLIESIQPVLERSDQKDKDIEDFISDIISKLTESSSDIDWDNLSENNKELLRKYLFELAVKGYIEKTYDVFIYKVTLKTPTVSTRIKIYREIEKLNADEIAINGVGISRDHFTLIDMVKNLKYSIVRMELDPRLLEKYQGQIPNIFMGIEPKTEEDYKTLENFLMQLDLGILDTMRRHLYNMSVFVSILSLHSNSILKNL